MFLFNEQPLDALLFLGLVVVLQRGSHNLMTERKIKWLCEDSPGFLPML